MKKLLILFAFSLILFIHTTSTVLPVQEDPPVDAPDFVLTDLEGNTISLSDMGGEVVFLNFWATWCIPCKKEIPFFNEAYQTHKDKGLNIIGVSIDRSEKIVKKFLGKREMVYPVVMGSQKFLRDYGVARVVPVTVIIDKKGKLRHKVIGDLEREEIEKYFQDLNNEDKG